jgi:hypothetical protein
MLGNKSFVCFLNTIRIIYKDKRPVVIFVYVNQEIINKMMLLINLPDS